MAVYVNPSVVMQPVDVWDGVPVHYKDSLALNVVVYDFLRDEIFASFATMERLRRNPAMLAQAQSQAKVPGVHTVPEVQVIPTHHVGQVYRKSMAVLNEYAHGLGSSGDVLMIRDEIETLRSLLDEAEATLDMCHLVQRINTAS